MFAKLHINDIVSYSNKQNIILTDDDAQTFLFQQRNLFLTRFSCAETCSSWVEMQLIVLVIYKWYKFNSQPRMDPDLKSAISLLDCETDSVVCFCLPHPHLWSKYPPCHHFPFPPLLSTCFTSYTIRGRKGNHAGFVHFVILTSSFFWKTRQRNRCSFKLII